MSSRANLPLLSNLKSHTSQSQEYRCDIWRSLRKVVTRLYRGSGTLHRVETTSWGPMCKAWRIAVYSSQHLQRSINDHFNLTERMSLNFTCSIKCQWSCFIKSVCSLIVMFLFWDHCKLFKSLIKSFLLNQFVNSNICPFVVLMSLQHHVSPHIVVMHCAITVTKLRLKLKAYTRLFSTLASREIQLKRSEMWMNCLWRHQRIRIARFLRRGLWLVECRCYHSDSVVTEL